MSRAWLFPIILAAMVATAVAALGSTITVLGPWYHGLVQPRWAPPDYVYGMGWTAIYALTVLAAVSGWRMMQAGESDLLITLYAINGFLNITWSLLFFQLQRPDWAVIEVIFLWLSVGSLILYTWRRSIIGAVLLIPYLLWVTFAGYLTMTIVRLNGPFS